MSFLKTVADAACNEMDELREVLKVGRPTHRQRLLRFLFWIGGF